MALIIPIRKQLLKVITSFECQWQSWPEKGCQQCGWAQVSVLTPYNDDDLWLGSAVVISDITVERYRYGELLKANKDDIEDDALEDTARIVFTRYLGHLDTLIDLMSLTWYEHYENLVWRVDFDGPGFLNPWWTLLNRHEAVEIIAALNSSHGIRTCA